MTRSVRTTMTAAKEGLTPLGKRSILSLPLVPRSSRLTERLLPDTLTPTPSALVSVPESAPSLLRRSRNVGEGAHYSYTTPLVLEFPYALNKDEVNSIANEEDPAEEKRRVEAMNEEERMQYGMEKARKEMERVERQMRAYEVDPATIAKTGTSSDGLTGYLPKARTVPEYPSARILGISRECLQDCLPDLDVGDTEKWVADHAGKDGPDCYSSGPMAKPPSPDDHPAVARYQLSDFLAGRLIGAQLPALDDGQIEHGAERGVAEAQHQRVSKRSNEAEAERPVDRWQRRSESLAKRQAGQAEYSGYAPWSNAYSGHQFGQWAGQLGDGRAITLMEAQDTRSGQRWEIQLKGAGRTPYSRFADGLAVLASSVREYLASEAMHGLGIPTSRALCLISVPDVSVMREQRNTAAITTRMAPIWTRVGSFEHHATRNEWESVRMLGEFTCREGYGWKEVGEPGKDSPGWAERLIRECAQRNAHMVALWQAYGFMHGVMNTDNISLLGLTIDYGPYGFMDIFDRYTICNKSDGEGRYSYHMQPTAAMFVMEQLTTSLAALVGFEREHGRAPRPGELVELGQEAIDDLGRKTKEELWASVKTMFMDKLIEQWIDGWRTRLALRTKRDDDRAVLIDPLQDVLEGYLDFTLTMRSLCQISKHIPSIERGTASEDDAQAVQNFVEAWIDWEKVPNFVRDARKADAVRWTEAYVARLREERAKANATSSASLEAELKQANPSFILRNWVADEVIQRLQQKDDTDFLARVLHMSLHPFEAWGEEVPGKDDDTLAEEKRLCSIGKLLTTNMPSCSS